MKTFAVPLLALLASPVFAQDIRGLEVCTAEKQMDRRTSCLQANVQFLQQALTKHAQDSRVQFAVGNAEIAALKAKLSKLEGDMAQLMAQLRAKADSGNKK